MIPKGNYCTVFDNTVNSLEEYKGLLSKSWNCANKSIRKYGLKDFSALRHVNYNCSLVLLIETLMFINVFLQLYS